MESIMTAMKKENDDKRIRRDHNLFKESVHKGVKCDQCGLSPIVGIWYKSATKENYDLCIDCESKTGHNDVFFKIKWPEDYENFLVDLKKAVSWQEEVKNYMEEEKSAFEDEPKFQFQS